MPFILMPTLTNTYVSKVPPYAACYGKNIGQAIHAIISTVSDI